LAENAGFQSTNVISLLYASHASGKSSDGVDIESLKGESKNAKEMGVFDSLISKQYAIRMAATTVVTILGIDQLIVAKAAGGPKPPQPGPMDADD